MTSAAAAIVCAHRQACRHDGRALCPCHTVQPPPRRQLRILRTRLGRLICDIRRKIAGNAELEAVFAWPLSRADQIRSQQQRQRGWKQYSFHAPEMECIDRGKASAPYEFGPSSPPMHRAPGGQFVLHARTLPGNPYDGHTLGAVIEATERLTGREIERATMPRPAPRLHLRPKTRGLRPHQTRAHAALRHRGGDRTYERLAGNCGHWRDLAPMSVTHRLAVETVPLDVQEYSGDWRTLEEAITRSSKTLLTGMTSKCELILQEAARGNF
jgi:hypothetical protein